MLLPQIIEVDGFVIFEYQGYKEKYIKTVETHEEIYEFFSKNQDKDYGFRPQLIYKVA